MSDGEDTKTLKVTASFPVSQTGHETVEFEVPADTTFEEAENRARREFWEICNYGWNAEDFEEGEARGDDNSGNLDAPGWWHDPSDELPEEDEALVFVAYEIEGEPIVPRATWSQDASKFNICFCHAFVDPRDVECWVRVDELVERLGIGG